jgi:hypothetical protein
MRDTRMVERKKTGRAKARKGVSSYWSHNTVQADVAVHLGQALIGIDCIHFFTQHAYTSTSQICQYPRMVLLIAPMLIQLLVWILFFSFLIFHRSWRQTEGLSLCFLTLFPVFSCPLLLFYVSTFQPSWFEDTGVEVVYSREGASCT